MIGCGFRAKYLPDVTVPYLTEIKFLKEIQPSDSGLRKTTFKKNLVKSPFYVYLKINGIENSGKVYLRFYQRQYFFTPVLLNHIGILFQQSLNGFIKLSSENNPFINFLVSPNAGSFAFKTYGISLFRQFVRGHFFYLSSRLITPAALNFSHFFITLFKSIKEKVFGYGKTGKYYEHIIFIDKVSGLDPGPYRYSVFLNNLLIYEGYLNIFSRNNLLTSESRSTELN